MHTLRRKILLKFLKLMDLSILAGSFLLAAALTYQETGEMSLDQFLALRIKVHNVGIFLGLLLVFYFILSASRLYASGRLSPKLEELWAILKVTCFAVLAVIPTAMIFRIRMATPIFILTFFLMSTSAMFFARFLLRQISGWVRLFGRNLRFMLIVGTNKRAIQFARKIEVVRELGYRIIGFVDSDWEGLKEFRTTGYPVVAELGQFPAYLRDHVVDEVMIALPLKTYYQQASQIASLCEEQGIICRYPSGVFDTKLARLKPGHFEGDTVIANYTGNMEAGTLEVKRFLDLLASLILLILLAPLFLVISLLIKRDSPGPVFFLQERMGINKRRFRLFKFRTMIRGAEEKMGEIEHLNEISGPVFKIRNDPRITRIGKFLRKTSIDELPQLINVLKGDMSLVGPRPLPVRDYNGFDQDWHRRRFSVRPGITCLWQVNGRSTIEFDKWMELDMEYIDHWSLLLDLKILMKTIPAVLKGSGAA